MYFLLTTEVTLEEPEHWTIKCMKENIKQTIIIMQKETVNLQIIKPLLMVCIKKPPLMMKIKNEI